MITRHILHPDIRVMVDDREWNRDQLYERIDRAKSYLIHERGARAGQKVVMLSMRWPHYLIWFLACAELGLEFIVSDYPGLGGSVSVREKLSLYGMIHYAIGNVDGEYFEKISDMADCHIDRNAWIDYPISETPIWATRDSVLIHSTTSGTTSMPKVCSHTHEFFHDLRVRNARVMGFEENDLCLHTKGLHHGSVAGVYFLPSLHRCRYHRWSEHEQCIDVIQTYGVNRALLFYDNIFQLRDQMIPTIKQDNLTIYVLSAVPKDVVDLVVGRMKHTIVSIYGCTETSGPVMISTARTTDWNPLLFDGPLDDFYPLSIGDDGLLSIGMPDGTSIAPGDQFAIENGKWVLIGRENLYRVRGQTIFLGVLANWMETQYGWKHAESFDLVFDRTNESIYLRADDGLVESLDAINNTIIEHFADTRYRIARMIVGPRLAFYTGIKFDGNEVRLRCRKHN